MSQSKSANEVVAFVKKGQRQDNANRLFALAPLGLVAAFIFIFYNICVTEARISHSLKVQLPHGGILIGRHLTTQRGRHMRAFLGIPYARPPIGELRFKAPVPYPSWQGERLAIVDSEKCTQRDPFRRDMLIEGSEDCLYLNVYAPEYPYTNDTLPTMVWFHGGGWECGSGISSFYGPDFLMDHNIILVSPNFRLGPLGFLSTETLDCPGNFGLKDQVEVLRWVQRNIAAFGGNPNSVTIFGESAGGASVTYHMLSLKTEGLFHRGIAQSGTYFNPWAQPAHKGVAAKRARKLAELVNCGPQETNTVQANDWKTTLACLRNRSAEEIVATIYDLFEWDFDPMIPFPPVVEPLHDEAFLTVAPRAAPQPHGLKLPLLLGATAEEGLLKTAALLNIPHLLEDFKSKFPKVLPIILNYDHHEPHVQQKITKQIEQFYFKYGHNYDKSNHQNLTNLISDGWFISGIDEYLRLRTRQNNGIGPTYAYLFDHKGAASFSEIFKGGRDEFYGSCHAEELQYLFPIGRELFVSAVPTSNDIRLKELMLEMWVNFAYNSNPNADIRAQQLPLWRATESYPITYARIGTKNDMHTNATLLHIEKALMQQRVDFWHHLQAHEPTNVVREHLQSQQHDSSEL